MSEAGETKVDSGRVAGAVSQLVKLLGSLEPEARKRAIGAALVVLGDSSHDEVNPSVREPDAKGTVQSAASGADLATFFAQDGKTTKPSENTLRAAAWHYRHYGNAAFSLADLRAIATDAGAVLPDRLDMTLKGAAKKGQKLFTNAAGNGWRPTAAAGLYFRDKYGVTPGRQTKSSAKE